MFTHTHTHTHTYTHTRTHTHIHTYTHRRARTCDAHTHVLTRTWPCAFRYLFQIGSTDALERKLDEAQRELQIPPERHVPVK